jgi:hypothetical protein
VEGFEEKLRMADIALTLIILFICVGLLFLCVLAVKLGWCCPKADVQELRVHQQKALIQNENKQESPEYVGVFKELKWNSSVPRPEVNYPSKQLVFQPISGERQGEIDPEQQDSSIIPDARSSSQPDKNKEKQPGDI